MTYPTIFILGITILGGLRGWLVHNYFLLKGGKSQESFWKYWNEAFVNVQSSGTKLMLIIPFFSKTISENVKATQLKVNVATFLIYIWIIVMLII